MSWPSGWSWFSGYNAQGPALIASKQSYQGDQEIVTYFAAKMMPVDHYICWGTPNDLRSFEYWEEHFDRG